MMEIWHKHRFVIILLIGIGIIDFITNGQSPWVLVVTLVSILITLLIEHMSYAKRKVYIFAQIGFIAGFFSGQFLYELLVRVYPYQIPVDLELYLIICFSYLGAYMPLMAQYGSENGLFSMSGSGNASVTVFDNKLLDTSVIIDGRINDMVATGFVSGILIVPKFVLNEIQALADSQDSIKRSRARRGLDVLNQLHEQKNIALKIISKDYPDIKGVDSKLIALAKEKNYAVFTNDYNLNKIARIEGVEVLNMNDLVNALKPVLLPGEELELDIVKEGKESGQGVGYLADGTMVVVANGSNLVGKKMRVQVTSMLQTSAGRIIFTEVI